MNRQQLRDAFDVTGPAVFPVIHVLDEVQTGVNIQYALDSNVAGVFLINHDYGVDEFIPVIRSVREEFPDVWLGINFLGVTGKQAFPVLAGLEAEGYRVNGYWGDDARIDESRKSDDQPEAEEIMQVKQQCQWDGLYFGGTAFKKQRPVNEGDYLVSARIAANWMDVVTTSGIATGREAGTGKIEVFREGCGDTALGLASGITPENVLDYAEMLDAILIATGINRKDDFYNIDPDRLKQLNEALENNT